MDSSSSYILVIGQPITDLPTTPLTGPFADPLIDPSAKGPISRPSAHSSMDSPQAAGQFFAPVVTTASPEQAVAKAQANHPHLVIFSGDAYQTCSPEVARRIRQSVQPEGVVIVALTESSELSWVPEEESTELDGFFVNPLSADVLSALNESAIAKQKCLQTSQAVS